MSFAGSGAEALCRNSGAPGFSLANGVGANLAPVNSASPKTARTITARDVAFPLRDPYSPVTRTGAPVPGLNAWPGRANVMGRKYYGLQGAPRVKTSPMGTLPRKRGFAGMGNFPDPGWDSELGLPPAMPPIGQPVPGSGGINWNQVFGGIFRTLPATVSAITGKYDPLNRTPLPTYAPITASQYGVAPQGYYYNSSGELVKQAASNVTDFITNNPLLVGGAVLGVVLLFMRSPSGRR